MKTLYSMPITSWGDINHGMRRWIDWNLIVDRTGGPRHVPGGFAAPMVAEEDGSYTKTVSYEYILEIAKTVRRGAVRIGSSVYSTQVEVTAVRNEDGSIGIVLLNGQKPADIFIRLNGWIMDVHLPQNSLNSIIIRSL